MKLGELSVREFEHRLRRQGVRFRVGPFITHLEATLSGLAEHIHFLYTDAPLEEGPCFTDFEVRVTPLRSVRWGQPPKAKLYIDGMTKFMPFERSIAMPILEWSLNWCVFNRPHQYLILHSAVLERGGRAVIMPAPPGSGKSTLCSALAHRGWRLMSDEVAPISPADGLVHAVPRPVGLKEGSIDVIRQFAPDAHVGRPWPGTHKGTVAHMRVPTESIDRVDEPARPAWLVCPRYEKDAPAQLELISKADTLLRVAKDAFNYSILGETGFNTLSDTIEACDCYAFTYGNLDEAIKVFDQLASAEHGSMMTSPEGVAAQ